MIDVKVKIPKTKAKADLKIIYKGKNTLHELITSKDDIIKSLRYYENKRNEINLLNIIYIEEDIEFDIFQKFISSIETQEIDLNENNYESLYYLSNKYEYLELQNEIKTFMNTRPDLKKIIDDYSNSFKNEKTANFYSIDIMKEEIIAKNLDASISSGILHKLPLEILVRILNSPKREIKNHHSLFQFITSLIKSRMDSIASEEEKENLSVLPSCLDYELMTADEIEELLKIEGSIQMMSPRNSMKKMKEMISREKEMNDKITALEEKLGGLEELLLGVKDEIRSQKEAESEIVKSQDEVYLKKFDEFSGKLKELEAKIEQEIASRNSQQKLIDDQINEAKVKEEELRKKLDEMKNEKENDKNNIDCSNGVFKHFFDQNHSNPVDTALITISGNSFDSSYQKILKNIVDSSWKGFWASENVPNSYFKIDFTKHLIRIDRYRLRVGAGYDDYSFKSWVLTGTTSDNTEVVLDEVNNSPEITSSHQEITKSTQTQPFVRAIKLTMKGKCADGGDLMEFRNIELFGILKE
ncbi:hypothetical protein M9Y10_042693 [Tritrichomonas musculus]|uniref:F5/8 type C domain-containing protein n=1 Tax=Tritrichomonas musculus TaxID=1915356 RepID=A0ABR2JXU5_9EUKA